MTEPLALVFYQRILPGSQLVNRLQDLNYRVQTVAEAAELVNHAEEAKPILVLADLDSTDANVSAAIAQLRQNPATKHIPVIGFSAQTISQPTGVTLLVSDFAIANHLPQCLDQALQVE
jgi:CheY-like chemotaxis protein